MDSFNIADLKIEKANAILRYRRFQKITSLLRFVELCVVLIVISRFSTQFGVVFGLSGEFFRRLTVTLFSPRFVFVVGNAIVIILFIKSGRYTNQDDTKNSSKTDLYEEYVEIIEKNRNIPREESEYIKKQSICEDDDLAMANTYMYSSRERKINRSHSENLKAEKASRELRRSATEMCKKSVNSGEKPVLASDEMSSEQFRQTVEAFIARQQRFLREEEFSVVVSYEA